MSPPEFSYPMTAIPEYPCAAEEHEKDLKTNFMKVIEALKEEEKIKKKSLKESRKRQTKNWRKSVNSLKKAKKKQTGEETYSRSENGNRSNKENPN